LERLAAAIERDYDEVHELLARAPEQRRVETVKRLLAGESAEPAELAELEYELGARWHLGVIATGSGLHEALRRVSADMACDLLDVSDGDTVWAWLGAPRQLEGARVERLLSLNQPMWGSLAIGAPRQGRIGWRRTHREAMEAFALALRRPETIVPYADSPLLAAALQNHTLAMSLRELLMPLRSRPDGGATLLETLRAYIDTECNCTSAASLLRVRRQTVTSRLRMVEELLDRRLATCLAEIDTALRLVSLSPEDSPPA
jgi:PucR-like helix-turn-helix protein/diguanylate cyclase with GGDEF domain